MIDKPRFKPIIYRFLYLLQPPHQQRFLLAVHIDYFNFLKPFVVLVYREVVYTLSATRRWANIRTLASFSNRATQSRSVKYLSSSVRSKHVVPVSQLLWMFLLRSCKKHPRSKRQHMAFERGPHGIERIFPAVFVRLQITRLAAKHLVLCVDSAELFISRD